MEYDLTSVDYILETTRSVRKRLNMNKPVDNQVVMECLEIALQAPSGSNAQGWKWLIVTNPEIITKIANYYKKSFDEYIGIPSEVQANKNKILSSALHLSENLAKVPMLIFACVHGVAKNQQMAAGLYGSIMPAAWSLMLALRARGIGSSWTTLHLKYEKECNEILGIPEGVTTAVLLPVAYFKGKTFKKAERKPASKVTYWNTWGTRR